jgi:hypothetical protein
LRSTCVSRCQRQQESIELAHASQIIINDQDAPAHLFGFTPTFAAVAVPAEDIV